MNPYDRNGHRANDNCMSTYCMSCGRFSSQWSVWCDNKAVLMDEHDEYGCRTRKALL